MSVSPTAISKHHVACGEISDLEVPIENLNLSAEQIIEKISFLENEAALLSLGNLKILPIEIIFNILYQLPPEDLSYLARVNTVFKNICYDSQLWKAVLSKDTNLAKKEYQRQAEEKILIDKFRHGLCTMHELTGHSYAVETLLRDEDFLYSGSSDDTIRVWDVRTNEGVATLEGHTIGVKCICRDEHFLYSGSRDQTIKIWDTKTWKCVGTLKGHEGFINCLWKDGNFLYSGSGDATIRVWDVRTNECVAILRGHQDIVLCICVEENILYSGSWDGRIKIWDIEAKECAATLIGHSGSVQCILKEKDFLYLGFNDGSIGIWDTRIWEYSNMPVHKDVVTCIRKEGDFLYSSSEDGTIKICNTITKQCVATFPCFQDGQNVVLCIHKEGNVFYSTSYAKVIIRDFNVSYFTLLEAGQAIGEQKKFDLFFSFSKVCKNEIYKELYTIAGISRDPFKSDIENPTLELAIYRFVLKHIASLFEKGSKRKALDLFHKLPSKIKDPIYEELLKLDINTAHHKATTGSSIFDSLPAELLYQMSFEVFPEDLLSLARVNKAFKDLTSGTQLWKTVLSKHTDLKTKEEYLSRIQEKIQIDKMKNGIYTEQEFAVYHDYSVTCFCKEETIFYTGFNDGTIKIWDGVAGQCIGVLQCERNVCSMHIDKTILYVGTADAIEIWDTLTKERIDTLRGVQGYVYCIRKDKNILYSGSSNGMIKMWDLTKKHCIGFFGHLHGGVSRLLNEGHILYAAVENNVKIWNAATRKAIATLGCNTRIYCLFREGNFLYVGTWDAILIWDLAKQECIEVLQGHRSLVYSLCKEGNILYSGAYDGTIRAWDLTTNQCVATSENPDQQCVLFLCKEKDVLYSGSLDKKVRIWDFSVSYSTLLKAAQAILHEGDFDLYTSFSEVCLNATNEEVKDLQTMDPNISTYKAIGLAIYRVVAKQIDSLMKTGSRRQGIALLKKLPAVIQDVIYDEGLGTVEWKKINPSCLEHAFLNTTNDKRKEAIQSFLNEI